MYSPKITADWETKIAKIADGKMSEEEFLQEFKEFLKHKVSEVKNTEKKITFQKRKRSERMLSVLWKPYLFLQ